MGQNQTQHSNEKQQEFEDLQKSSDEQDSYDQENNETSTTYDVKKWIDNSISMEYLWCKNKDHIEHTSVLLKFNDMPVLTIDFGGKPSVGQKVVAGSLMAKAYVSKSVPSLVNKAAKVAASMPLNGEVSLNLFNSLDVTIVGSFAKLSLKSREEKENAMNMFNMIKQIDPGKYRLLGNNCRSYVITVATFLRNELREFSGENWSEFEFKMVKLLSEDAQKFKEFVADAVEMFSQISTEISDSVGDKISLKS